MPAFTAAPISSTLQHPPLLIAATIWFIPTLLHMHTIGPGSGRSGPGRPAMMRDRAR